MNTYLFVVRVEKTKNIVVLAGFRHT